MHKYYISPCMLYFLVYMHAWFILPCLYRIPQEMERQLKDLEAKESQAGSGAVCPYMLADGLKSKSQ